jgi:hypothetical protein
MLIVCKDFHVFRGFRRCGELIFWFLGGRWISRTCFVVLGLLLGFVIVKSILRMGSREKELRCMLVSLELLVVETCGCVDCTSFERGKSENITVC